MNGSKWPTSTPLPPSTASTPGKRPLHLLASLLRQACPLLSPIGRIVGCTITRIMCLCGKRSKLWETVWFVHEVVFVLRDGDDISVAQVGSPTPPNSKKLIRIKYTNGLYRAKVKGGETFLVLRGIKSGQFSSHPFGYRLSKKTVAQFGHVRLQVRELFKPSLSKGGLDEVTAFGECELCQKESASEGTLVSPCKCLGCAHIGCLKKWCQDRIIQQDKRTLAMHELRCFNCKSRLSVELCLRLGLLDLGVASEGHCVVFSSLGEDKEAGKVYATLVNQEGPVTIVSMQVNL
eukprot:TRINITY_DN2359_c0_g1_i2.p1 TRINITY_DN2359_c0_g1~~TRINITY_DN2359_c0_g1_i2.p1  ORF type:complete len:291 (-),score=-3.11 TRINITY_DN2359_c0_g1_i2:454-1326(-)